MLTNLDVVNAQLASMGESPITEGDLGTYPLAQEGLLKLRLWSRTFQTRGWWFNTVHVDFTPDASGVVEFPCGILRVEGPGAEGLSIRGNTLYDHYHQETRTRAVRKVTCIVELAFEDLPPVAQHYVMALAVRAFQNDRDTTESRQRSTKEDVVALFQEVNAEHIRAVRANNLLTPRTLAKILNIGVGLRRGIPVRS